MRGQGEPLPPASAGGGEGKLTSWLEWWCEWREHLPQLEALVEQGEDIPAVSERPRLWPDCVEAREAFFDLCRTRAPLQPITFVEIAAWLDVHGIRDRARRVELAEQVLAMDEVARKFSSMGADRGDLRTDRDRDRREAG